MKTTKALLATLLLAGGLLTSTVVAPPQVTAEPIFKLAQNAQWKSWNWPQYNVKFQLPVDMKILRSNASEFSLTSPNFSVYIVPWKDSSLSAKQVAYQAYKTYTVVSNKTVQAEGDISVDISESGFNGYMVFGKGWDTKAGRWLHYGLVGMASKEHENNFYIRYAWWDEPNTNAYYEQLSESIAKTFAEME